jgi:RNA polymerase sigma-70 factor (ECF subfamily)
VRDREPLPAETLALVARAGSGDRRSAEKLIVLYQQRVARLVIAQTNDASHYEDLCQTIFVKMVLALPRLREPERFEAWLFQIARNVCRDHLRARRGWRRLFVPYEAGHDSIAAPDDTPDRPAAAEERIDELPEAQRAILRQSLDGRRSYEELARLSHSSVSAVKSRLHRARQNLRSLLVAGDCE